jgi:hypothetical protein
MVSPYLLRPVRSLKEIEGARPKTYPLDAVVKRALTEAKASGQGPHDQIDRAAMAVLKRHPEMTALDALAAVQRVRRKLRLDRPR